MRELLHGVLCLAMIGALPHCSQDSTPPDAESRGDEVNAAGAGTAPKAKFPAKWSDGTACANEPKIQSFQYSEDTFILRQSLCTHGEGPFMYLLLGKEKALLLDTGTGDVDVRAAVAPLLAQKSVELVVAHSHSHGDHVSGDRAFQSQPKTVVVGTAPSAVRKFFAVPGDAPARFDLGGRVLDVLAIPGHEAAHLAFYDAETQLLLTGDTLYPGRLFIDDWQSYKKSVARLDTFIADRPVAAILGAHIEMPKVGPDYAMGARQHPNEHVLQLTTAELHQLRETTQGMGDVPRREVLPHFILSP